MSEHLWQPCALSSPPKLWLSDDSVEVTDAGQVVKWRDVSQNAYHFGELDGSRTAILVYDPDVRGRPVVRFDGVDDRLINTSSGFSNVMRNVTAGWSFVVYRKRTPDLANGDKPIIWLPRGTSTASRFLLEHSGATSKNRPFVGGRRLDADAFASAVAPTEITSTDWRMLYGVAIFGANSATTYIDGELVATASALWSGAGATSDTQGFAAAVIGSNSGASAFSDIDVACLVLGSGTYPTDAEVDRIFGWAAHRYGLTDKLPIGHPYKTLAPAAGAATMLPGVKARDEASGIDSVFGSTQRYVDPTTILAQRARVTLLRQRDKRPVRRTWSDAATGAYRFDSVNTARDHYIALAEYPSNPDDPAAEEYLRPVAGVSPLRGQS